MDDLSVSHDVTLAPVSRNELVRVSRPRRADPVVVRRPAG